MTWSVLLTVLPNGFNPANGRARLSLVASPRLAGPSTTLGNSPLARWPTIVAGMGALSVVTSATKQRIPATVVSPTPDQALWDRLFAPTTPMDADTDDAPIFQPVVTSLTYGPAASCLAGLYDQVLQTSATEMLGPDHPVAQAIGGLNAWATPPGGISQDSARRAALPADVQAAHAPAVADLLDPARITADRVQQAATLLREQGHEAAAVMAPLATVMRRLNLTGGQPADRQARANGTARATATGSGQPSSYLAGIKKIEQADFHQVVGLLLDHPVLALRLGLRVDLEVAAFAGEHSIRVVTATGLPFNGPVAVPQPWSRVISNPTAGRFIMAPNPNGDSEVVNGMLDLRPPTPSGPGKTVVSDLDVAGLTEQLHVLAASMAAQSSASAGASDSANVGTNPPAPPAPVAMPPRRDVGLIVAQTDRRSGTIEQTLARAGAFRQTSDSLMAAGNVAGAENAPTLYADDVTAGYRVDVSTNGGAYRSLMRRHVTYQIGGGMGPKTPPIETHDEGQIDPIVAVEQHDAQGNPHLLVGEELFGFSGWSLSAPRPGLKVVAEGRDAQGNETPAYASVEPAPAPGYPLRMTTRAEPGTVTPLRYGRSYSFQARAVDLAGNAIEPAQGDPSLASAPTVYRRHEPVPPPILIPRRSFREGESLVRLVVYTDGEGNLIGPPCERHVSPPKASQHLAELHGLFDGAFGPDTPARAEARKRLLEVARREAGSYLDLQVANPNGSGMVQVKGIAITTNDPVNRPPQTKLPIPHGAHLPEGEYVVHDAPFVICPFLPDPGAAGAAIWSLPGIKDPVKVSYGTADWPAAQPFRLVLQAGTGPAPTAKIVQEGSRAESRPVLNIALPPGMVTEVQMASMLTPAVFDVMDPIASFLRQYALDGQVYIFSPRQPLTLVHAVRRPIEKPTLRFFSTVQIGSATAVYRPKGETAVNLDGLVHNHAKTTAQVDVVATWDEVIDRPRRPVTTESRREVAGSFVVAPGQSDIGFGAMPDPRPADVPAVTPGPALRHRFSDTKRRQITYRAVGTTRFREYFPAPAPGDRSLERDGDGVVIDIPNTARPQPVSIHSTVPIFRWARKVTNGIYTSVRKTVGVRVYLRRPWHTTGHGERLGVVVFGSTASGTSFPNYTDARKKIERLVSQWGRDPLEGGGPYGLVLTASDFPAGVDNQALANLPEFSPIADTSYNLGVVGHAVHFDAERDLWYADVEVNLPEERFPFIRLGLSRFQPVSTYTRFLSRVVQTDFIQLPPARTLTAQSVGVGGCRVSIRVSGSMLRNTTFTAEHHRRILDPTLVPKLDITERSPQVSTLKLIPDTTATVPTVRGSLGISAPASSSFTLPAELMNGRIVVREEQHGLLHLRGDDRSRVVYLETFDRDIVPIPTTAVVDPNPEM